MNCKPITTVGSGQAEIRSLQLCAALGEQSTPENNWNSKPWKLSSKKRPGAS